MFVLITGAYDHIAQSPANKSALQWDGISKDLQPDAMDMKKMGTDNLPPIFTYLTFLDFWL